MSECFTRISLAPLLSYFSVLSHLDIFWGLSSSLTSLLSFFPLMTLPPILHRNETFRRQHLQAPFITSIYLHLRPHWLLSWYFISPNYLYFWKKSLPSRVHKNCISFMQLQELTLTILQFSSCNIVLFTLLALLTIIQ